tara:strand:- start:1932 stop:2114 length:183 start_codon:yes stop_codon:yes gene_type:complete
MARINLKFTKGTDSDSNPIGFYFNCEESDETTFKAAKVSEGYTFVEKTDPDMSNAKADSS